MADKLLLVLANTDPASDVALSAPLFQATVAAALDYQVEMVFTGQAGVLARQGFAASIPVAAQQDRSLYDLIRDAHAAGVRFKVCTPTDDDVWDQGLIPEIDEMIGAAYVIGEAMSDNTITFTY